MTVLEGMSIFDSFEIKKKKEKKELEMYVPWSPRTEGGAKHSAVHSVTHKSLEVSHQKSYQKNKMILKYFVSKHLFSPQSFLLIF